MKLVALFLRHGDTDLNESNDFRGDIDVPLNKKGHDQAEYLVKFFKHSKFSKAYRSTRSRTAQTIKPLMLSKDMEAKPTEDLDSLDTGDFAGLPKSEENLEKLKYYQEHPEEKIPGGEMVRTFRNRVDSRLMAIVKQGEETSHPTIACVHGSVLKELSRLITGDMKSVRVDPGGAVGVFKVRNGYALKALLHPVDGAEEDRPGS